MPSFPTTWPWNVGVEHEIVSNTKVELMYVGTAGRDQLRFWDANQVPPANRLDYARTASGGPGGAFRPYTAFGDTASPSGATAGRRSTTRCRRSS